MASTDLIYRFPEFDFLRQVKLWTNRVVPFGSDLSLGNVGVEDKEIPINHISFGELLKYSQRSKVGIGRETVYREEIRGSNEIIINEVNVHEQLLTWLQVHVDQMALELNQPTKVTLEPYKLILYRPGDHFDEHIDAEHSDNQVMTLSVSIPAGKEVKGGNLVIEGESIPHPVGDQISLTLFYTDVYHKVERVEEGERIVLIFNVIQKQAELLPVFGLYWDKFARGIQELRKRGVKQIGFLANHLYMTPYEEDVRSKALKGLDLIGYLLFKQISAVPLVEKVAEENGNYYFEALLDMDMSRCFGTLYYNTTEGRASADDIKDVEAREIRPVPRPGSIGPFTHKPKTHDDSYDSIRLKPSEPKYRAIIPEYLMGQTVLLESSGRLQKNFKSRDVHLGNEGFEGEIWTNTGIFVRILA